MNLKVDTTTIQERNGCCGATSRLAWHTSQTTFSKQHLQMGVGRQERSHYAYGAEDSVRKSVPAIDLLITCSVTLIAGSQYISPPPWSSLHRYREFRCTIACLLSGESLTIGKSDVVTWCLGLPPPPMTAGFRSSTRLLAGTGSSLSFSFFASRMANRPVVLTVLDGCCYHSEALNRQCQWN